MGCVAEGGVIGCAGFDKSDGETGGGVIGCAGLDKSVGGAGGGICPGTICLALTL